MNVDESAIGVYPNVAIDPATGERYGAANRPDGESDAHETRKSPESRASKGDICDFDASHDTREKLETEIDKFIQSPSSIPKFARTVSVTRDTLMGWLDRQDAITQREFAKAQEDTTLAVMRKHDAALAEAERLRSVVEQQADSFRKAESALAQMRNDRDWWQSLAAGREMPEGVEWPRFSDGTLMDSYGDAVGVFLAFDGSCWALMDWVPEDANEKGVRYAREGWPSAVELLAMEIEGRSIQDYAVPKSVLRGWARRVREIGGYDG